MDLSKAQVGFYEPLPFDVPDEHGDMVIYYRREIMNARGVDILDIIKDIPIEISKFHSQLCLYALIASRYGADTTP